MASQAARRWGTGDWNADAELDSTDLVVAFQKGGYEQGPRAAVRAVPEPSTAALVAVGVLIFALRCCALCVLCVSFRAGVSSLNAAQPAAATQGKGC